MEMLPGPNGTIGIRWDYPHSIRGLLPNEAKEEFENPDSGLCFAKISARLAQGECDLDQYLDGILLHLKKRGATKHLYDKAPSRSVHAEDDLASYHVTDVFAGSLKALLWSDDFEGFGPQGAKCFPVPFLLCIRVFNFAFLRMESLATSCRFGVDYRKPRRIYKSLP